MKLSNLSTLKPSDALMSAAALFLTILSIAAVTLLVIQLTKPTNGYEGRTITVSATGDAYRVPDIAEFTYTITKEGKNVATVQTEVTKQANEVLNKLVALGVDKKDIQTQNISANPKYEWQTKNVICPAGQYCPPDGKQVLVGYESSTTYAVTLRDLDLASKVLQTLGDANVTNIWGPNFTNEDQDTATSEARNEALAEARVKAQEMAKAMGVRLGKVVSFNEDNGGYPVPMYAGNAMRESAAMDMAVKAVPAPQIVAGQDKVNVTVNVTYRIK